MGNGVKRAVAAGYDAALDRYAAIEHGDQSMAPTALVAGSFGPRPSWWPRARPRLCHRHPHGRGDRQAPPRDRGRHLAAADRQGAKSHPAEKAEALSGPRVVVASTAAEALASSPLTIVSVSDHEPARVFIEGGVDLMGKVVASTSFMTPEQARTFAAVGRAAGGHYLDLAIAAYPSEVRSGTGVFFVSGDRTAFEAHR